ncbi:hypothetical protein SRABI80_00601 [Peribacillus frigoritolerans]|nr:hypothetical protein SRABI80_00601 [Peribacillus frigoritolerans]
MNIYRELETVPSLIGRVAEAAFFLCANQTITER